MAIEVSMPGTAGLQLQHLLLDLNGTLTTAGS
jgi:soluble P-type ATPase